jgi:hypothetical protein
MALTPEQIAELERLKAMMRQPAADAQRKAQAAWNAEQMANKKASGGEVSQDAMRLALMNKGGGLEKFLSDSKIKDRLYHATPKNFKEFKLGGKDPKISGPAIWLSADPKNQPAMHNIGSRTAQFREGVNVMPVYAQSKNPMMLDDKGMLEWAQAAFANGSKEFPELLSPETVEAIKQEGYDSIVHADPYKTGRPHEIIMFHPNKIKSAIGNRGTYDTSKKDITKARGGRVTHAHHLEIEERLL